MSPEPDSKKKMLTIVSRKQAKKGLIFVYIGPMSECKSCKVKNICFSLSPGQTYVVTGVREVTHKCEVFADGGQVVEVEIHPKTVAVDKKKGIEGSVVTLQESKCKDMTCPHYNACTTANIKPGSKLKIVSVEGSINCPENRVAVNVLPAE